MDSWSLDSRATDKTTIPEYIFRGFLSFMLGVTISNIIHTIIGLNHEQMELVA